MHLKGGAYYHVTLVGGKRDWEPIGKTYAEAIVKYGQRESASFRRGDLFADLADEFMLRVLPHKKPKTQKEWRRVIGKLKQSLSGVRADALEPPDVATMRDGLLHKPATANKLITILRVMYRYGIDWGYVTSNPAASTLPADDEPKPKRYLTNAEFARIRLAAPLNIRVAMDLAYVTGIRIGDILAMRWSDVTQDGVYVEQEKNEVRGVYRVTDGLKAILERAKRDGRKVGSLWVIARRDGKPYSYYGFRSIYDRAVKRSKVAHTTFHDIRGKAITDAKVMGREPQEFSLHKTRAQANEYVRLRDVPVVEPMPIVENCGIVEA